MIEKNGNGVKISKSVYKEAMKQLKDSQTQTEEGTWPKRGGERWWREGETGTKKQEEGREALLMLCQQGKKKKKDYSTERADNCFTLELGSREGCWGDAKNPKCVAYECVHDCVNVYENV